MATIDRLHAAGREAAVIMVVRPDTVSRLPEGIAWLRDRGIRHIAPSLDLWTAWSPADATELERAQVAKWVQSCRSLCWPGCHISASVGLTAKRRP